MDQICRIRAKTAQQVKNLPEIVPSKVLTKKLVNLSKLEHPRDFVKGLNWMKPTHLNLKIKYIHLFYGSLLPGNTSHMAAYLKYMIILKF